MLSAETLSEIAHALGTSGVIDPVHKNRRAMRIQHHGDTCIFRTSGKSPAVSLQVQMRDLSARGCSFNSREKLAIGSNFVIQFSRTGQTPASVLCTVIHCRTMAATYRIGAEFTCSLDAKSVARATSLSDLDRIRNSILT
jgi:hypothetical protein